MRRFVLLLLFGVLATAAVSVLYAQSYQFVLASEEARTALVVTEELNTELKAATYKSDLIAFGILGSILSAVAALACSSRSSGQQKAMGAGVGLVLGFLAGAAGAAIGHWYVENMRMQLDPMVQWALRWTLILLPVALAAAIATAVAGTFRRDIANALAGGVIGAFLAAVAFTVLHGIVTQIENASVIMPSFQGNRIVIVASAIFGIGLGLLWQVKNAPLVVSEPTPTTTTTTPAS